MHCRFVSLCRDESSFPSAHVSCVNLSASWSYLIVLPEVGPPFWTSADQQWFRNQLFNEGMGVCSIFLALDVNDMFMFS